MDSASKRQPFLDSAHFSQLASYTSKALQAEASQMAKSYLKNYIAKKRDGILNSVNKEIDEWNQKPKFFQEIKYEKTKAFKRPEKAYRNIVEKSCTFIKSYGAKAGSADEVKPFSLTYKSLAYLKKAKAYAMLSQWEDVSTNLNKSKNTLEQAKSHDKCRMEKLKDFSQISKHYLEFWAGTGLLALLGFIFPPFFLLSILSGCILLYLRGFRKPPKRIDETIAKYGEKQKDLQKKINNFESLLVTVSKTKASSYEKFWSSKK